MSIAITSLKLINVNFRRRVWITATIGNTPKDLVFELSIATCNELQEIANSSNDRKKAYSILSFALRLLCSTFHKIGPNIPLSEYEKDIDGIYLITNKVPIGMAIEWRMGNEHYIEYYSYISKTMEISATVNFGENNLEKQVKIYAEKLYELKFPEQNPMVITQCYETLISGIRCDVEADVYDFLNTDFKRFVNLLNNTAIFGKYYFSARYIDELKANQLHMSIVSEIKNSILHSDKSVNNSKDAVREV
ncbi:hypothetical protein HS7_09660 [Sulfolobales archaeon HS-7]|nr:hypothetical protein HS7_09660 [Sulfolobales archaeon HS-7]